VAYESAYEQFEAVGPDGLRRTVRFQKSGFLALGDQPELYFFRVAEADVIVGISGDSLRQFQRGRRHLSREEKIDLAGLLLKRCIEAGVLLVAEKLLIRDEELAALAGDLGLSL